MKNKLLIIISASILLFACEEDKKKKETIVKTEKHVEKQPIIAPEFNSDSAYFYVQQQVDFGPRFPNNEAHGKCADFLKDKLSSFGLNTFIQTGKSTTFNKKVITIKNIIGEFKPELERRILLFAHWDSRPFADQDSKDMTKPILGANDGASGVGILLEVARQLTIQNPNIGVDIIFFDAEDYGEPSSGMITQYNGDSWCLGSQYWAKNPHKPNYKAEYGILLDMVGSANANFTHEAISMNYAPNIVRKVWNKASELGHGNHFVSQQFGFQVTDDHKYINEIANIPSIDIIHYDRNTGSFHHSWHTHNDNMEVIDKNTLKAVGETLLGVILDENK
jgi:Zn-dependent M28 family amino/carboxypeptidase